MKTVEFRDGEKDVPDHVAILLVGIATTTMTYDQAVRASELKLLADRLNAEQKRMVDAHIKGLR